MDQRRAAALAGGSALGVRVQPRALLDTGNVSVPVVHCLLLKGSLGFDSSAGFPTAP
jgi:hypothetical protein